jgi:type IV secretory pathway TraG/TraD family ATPase VirD4
MRADFGELITEIQEVDQEATVPLGTAQWMGLREASARLSFRPDTPSDRMWLGEACDAAATPLGYADDRHVCLVSGTRGGKGGFKARVLAAARTSGVEFAVICGLPD